MNEYKMTDAGKPDSLRELGIYVHIPFCMKKCDYCDFLSAPASKEIKKDYINALLAEIESYRGLNLKYIVPTIFIGGGTPSCLEESEIGRIMDCIHQIFNPDQRRLEATIEVNPGAVTKEKFKAYQSMGINRLSIGLQSAANKELKLLGRIHTFEQFLTNYHAAREAGFHNINIDLMSSLPGQTLKSWENTLNTVIGLQPEHISAYSLIIEEGTKFYERYSKGAEGYGELPDEDTDREMYHMTKHILDANGYHRYEISNYAKPGYECRHNSSYWIGSDYLGLGLGASSLLDGTRFSNMKSLQQYILSSPNGLRENIEQLTLQQRMEEFMILGLRMVMGISKAEFYRRFQTDIDSVYGNILKKQEKNGLLEINGDRICLTEYGLDISNYVLSEFILS